MKRKLVTQGKKALTVTLPINWIRDHNLNSGDEIEISPLDNDLRISTFSNKTTIKSTTINISTENARNCSYQIRYALAQAYDAGYNEIIIKSELLPNLSTIQKEITTFTGLEIVSAEKEKLIIRCFLNDHDTPVDLLITKMIQVSKTIAETLKKEWNQTKLKEITELFNMNLRLSNHCRRTIHQNKYGDHKTYAYYYLASRLERLSANLFYLGKKIIKLNPKKSDLLEELFEIQNKIYECFLKKDFNEIMKLQNKLYDLSRNTVEADAIKETTKKIDPVILIHYYSAIMNLLSITKSLQRITLELK
ncbi:AbrB/MazE/SpoVT family DNA-binding domain-containing protein [Candidatus Woesearchaeota archaeon]|jgi:hypothetical protein|nr:AbrB/MazE/SpoVT family DNA-binding domain-containing protein [Candidatus Woesearchaeota archaeon]